jgi:hypothetical protein
MLTDLCQRVTMSAKLQVEPVKADGDGLTRAFAALPSNCTATQHLSVLAVKSAGTFSKFARTAKLRTR